MPARAKLPTTVVVAGGKGGVGKTTVAVNLALSLARGGRRVGLADADVHGPDSLRLLGLTRRRDAESVDLWHNPGETSRFIAPVEAHGIRLVSVQMLLGESQDFSAIGLTQMLVRRLLFSTAWNDTELLVIDLPPGTGEVTQHVLGSAVPAGAVLVVTPQDVAHLDARKLLSLLGRWKTPILGGVENMAPMLCPCCGSEIELFPPTPFERSIWGAGVERLASLPFSTATVADGERGQPPDPDSIEAQRFNALAEQVLARLHR
jgi:ATP-binding protein involved in chromosome partitioning